MNKPIIRLAHHEDQKAWDAYVFNNPYANPYQLFAWGQAVERNYGHKSYNLIAEVNGKISGVFPLSLFKIPLFPKKLVSLPFCDLGGILYDNDIIFVKLFHEARKIAMEIGSKGFEIRNESDLPTFLNDGILFEKINNRKVRMILKLPSNSDELWNGFKSKLRSQIRKSKKNELKFKWGNNKDIESFYDVFSRNMHDLGSPVHNVSFIKNIMCGYNVNAKMGLIFYKNIPVGCGIILLTKTNACIPWASTLKGYNYLAPNMMLYWNFLKFASNSGRLSFDFGRSTPGEGTYKFKRQWGAGPKELLWASFSKKEKSLKKDDDFRNQFEAIWKKLPYSCTRMFGPPLRKYISL